MMRTAIALALLLTLTGCYETVSERTRREDMEQRIKQLERGRDCKQPEWSCKGGCCPG